MSAPPIVNEVLHSSGQPLDPGTSTFMESHFGHDFSQVRVHTDGKAAESARTVNALAYTVGHNVVFNSGQYRPGTNSGRRLLAHELAHTLQQPDASLARRALEVAPTDDAYEREAERVAEQAVNRNTAIGNNVTPSEPRLQRLGDLSKRPSTLRCPLPPGSPSSVVETILFARGVSALTATQKATIEAFVGSWRALGGSTDVRIDGFASTSGGDRLNWRLSCQRTEAVVAELRSPSSRAVPGIPSSHTTFFAHGETAEFSTRDQDPNQRATISSTAPVPPPTPAPSPSTPPPSCASFPCLGTDRCLTATEQGTATSVFGTSLDFSRIRISDSLGAGGAPWTNYSISPLPPFASGTCLNLGATFSNATLIHELVHSWQSQHHSIPTAYMVNSAASQALSIVRHGDRGCAYRYTPGAPFGAYAAEQIAQIVEDHFGGTAGLAAYIAIISATPMGSVSAANVASLAVPRIGPPPC